MNLDEIKYKDYKTVTYKNIDIIVSPELLQDTYAGTQPLSILERHIYEQYKKHLSFFRDIKIDQILDELN